MKEVKTPRKPFIFYYIIVLLVLMLVNMFVMPMIREASIKKVDYNEFMNMTLNKQIKKVEIDDSQITFTDQNGTVYKTSKMDGDWGLTERLYRSGAEFTTQVQEQMSPILSFLLSWIIPIVLFSALGYYAQKKMMNKMSGGGPNMMFGMGKSNAKVYVPSEEGIRFSDVAGEDEAKENLAEIVDYLHQPSKYSEIGASMPKGVLLVGPPGTGKTMLAKAVAGEANVPFFSISGSEFVEMFVGMGASKVRDLFKQAKEKAPCIVFIDEIDSIGKSRDSRYGGGNDEREQTLNALLAEMDGFDTSKGILILAATNRPEVLDPALLRPGRFDRRIIVDAPDFKGRLETLRVHSKDVKLDETVDLDAIANITSGAVGSDLANMVNEAAINAVKCGRRAISQADLMEAVEVVIAGKEKKDRILSKEEKKIVSYHEVGHALVTALQKHAEPVQKITIVPRTMGSLGYVIQAPEEEKYLMSKEELNARLVTFLAGRAAEEIVFDSVTTGASNDMEKATKIARSMIAQYGMSEKFGLMSLEQVENPYLGNRTTLNCSDKTATEIEEEVKILLKEKYEEAKKLLRNNRAKLDKIAKFLYEKETITGKEFMDIFEQCEREEAEKAEASKTQNTENNANAENLDTQNTEA